VLIRFIEKAKKTVDRARRNRNLFEALCNSHLPEGMILQYGRSRATVKSVEIPVVGQFKLGPGRSGTKSSSRKRVYQALSFGQGHS